ncbi:SCO family protein [Mammaliicoccus sciuri]|uniref:SCO family protein n=1 Tax=Sporosarcina sp. FSL K6-3508 TaxID=2921557 RepID=UPI00315A73AC
MKKKLIISSFVLVGFIAVLFLWPQTVVLPKLGKVENLHLSTTKGQTFTFSDEKPKLVTFFYTHCPDVCPMTIMDLKMLQQQLQEAGVGENEYNVVLITLDPENDTAETIEQYKSQLDISSSNWFFLRGSAEHTKEVTNQFKMVYKKDQDGFIVHGTRMYLLDKKNTIRAYHDMNTGQRSVNLEALAENILALLQKP